jgi:hypothetical protein
MDSLVTRTGEAILRTADLLTTEFGIYCWDFLPYEAIAVILTYIFANKDKLCQDDIVRVRQWFGRSAFSERYRGASDNFISKDLKSIQKFIVEGQASPSSFGGIPDVDALLELSFRSNNARSRAFILLLAAHRPRNPTNGIAVDCTEALSICNKKQFHHVYPQAFLRRTEPEAVADALMNICILSASENRAIGDRNPHEYLRALADALGAQAESIFGSCLLPSPTETDYSALSYEAFLRLRAQLIHPRIEQVCRGDYV